MAEEYVSPLAASLKSEPLNLETLAKYVPLIHQGKIAQEQLSVGMSKYPLEQRRELIVQRDTGEDAKDKLVRVALPFVKNLAYREFRRRSAWNSRVPLEEIVQEGIAGLLKGIYAYNVDGMHTSPTNYLGQWVMTGIRRNVEALEHDFAVPYETIERHRKIRAIRSRLAGELGREPTDEEIVEAASQSAGLYGDTKMGRLDKTSRSGDGDRRRQITTRHIEEEREDSLRTGAVRNPADNNEDWDINTFAQGEIVGSDGDQNFEVEKAHMRTGLGSIINSALDALQAGTIQRDILSRKFGLPPYDQEQTLRDICAQTNVPRHKVNSVITAFTEVMSSKGSPFHAIISSMSIDEIESLELTWLSRHLGEYVPVVYTASAELTSNLRKPARGLRPRRGTATQVSDHDVIAHFQCPYHLTTFAATYASEDDVPVVKKCPQCARVSARIVD